MSACPTTPETKKSTHRVEVVPIKLEPHPNSDQLSVVKVFGYQVVVRTADWQNVPLGAYIVPDSMVDTSKTEFAWLGEHRRIKVKKLRGIVSQGLLIPAPEGSKIGDDVAELLQVTRYEPPEPLTVGGENERAPEGWVPTYDVESWHRYKHLLRNDEQVVITEKIHGTSARYKWFNDRMYCGSRTCWKRQDSGNLWWKVLERAPSIIQFCQSNPTYTLYGEVYGQVQDLKYGAGKNDVFFAGFDVWNGHRWLSWNELHLALLKEESDFMVPWVPVTYEGPYNEDRVRQCVLERSQQARIHGCDQLREGVVIKPVEERIDPEIGRVQLKWVSDHYLERAE